MKKILLILFLFSIPICGYPQVRKPIDSFLGIKFGCDSANFKKAILAKGGKQITASSSPGFLAFENFTYGSRKDILLMVKFVNNKAFEMDLVFANEPGAQSIPYFNALITDMNKIYGIGTPQKTINPPYKQGDGKEVEAIKSGNAKYIYYWYDYSNSNKIAITIDHTLKVFMVYLDDKLYNLHIHN